MSGTPQQYRCLTVTLMLSLLPIFHTVSAQPYVKIAMPIPVAERIHIGFEQAIHLIAQTNEAGLQFKWSLHGDDCGTLAGETTSSAVFYIPPPVISTESAEAVITVTVTHESGAASTDKLRFTLLLPIIEELETEQLLKIVDNCIEKNFLTTPETMNAYDISEKIRKRHPRDSEIKELLKEKFQAMVQQYQALITSKETELNRSGDNQATCQKVLMYYQGYMKTLRYLDKTLNDSTAKSEYERAKKHQEELKKYCNPNNRASM